MNSSSLSLFPPIKNTIVPSLQSRVNRYNSGVKNTAWQKHTETAELAALLLTDQATRAEQQ